MLSKGVGRWVGMRAVQEVLLADVGGAQT